MTILCCLSLWGNSFTNPLTIEILEMEDVECFGESSGYLELEASDGTAPYSYMLDGETNNSGIFEDLVAGIYDIVVTDETGCSSTINVEITEPDILELTLVSSTDAGCEGVADGRFQLETTGGSENYIYTLGGEVNTTGLFENLDSGTYEPLVEDENGCEMTIMVVINEGPGITSSIISQMDVGCFEEENGEIQVEAADGVEPYEYRIDADVNTSGIFSNLAAGTYTMLISDDRGCTTTQNFTIGEAIELTANLDEMNNLSCFGANDGSFQVSANGGNPPYTFSTANDSNTDGIFSGQAAGTYEVTVTDANNCTTDIITVTLTQPNEIVVNDPIVTNIDCFGNTNGTVEVSATGGAGNLTYTLGDDTNDTGMFSNLAAGTYPLTVTDADNCTTTLDVVVSQPDELVGIIDAIFNINCSGTGNGAIDFGVTGGTGDFVFTLNGMSNDNGLFEDLPVGDYTVMIVDANGCTASAMASIEESDELGVNILELNDVTCNGDTDGSVTLEANGGTGNYTYTVGDDSNDTGIFMNLAPGDYTASLSDDMGCSTTIDFTIGEPTAITFEVTVTMPIMCGGDMNGAIQVTAMGGMGDYTYSIGMQNNMTGSFENLSAGTYSITVSDASGCSTTMDFMLEEPDPLQLLVPAFEATSCFGSSDGFIQLMGLGGSGNYTFTVGDDSNMTGTFDDLAAGSYDIFIEDDNGCTAMIQFTVASPNEVFGQIIDIQNAGCNMMLGSIEVQGMGGTGAFMYTLEMETNDTGIFEELEAGMYEMLLTDENGCTGTLAFNIEENENVSAMIVEQQNVDCAGEATGSVEISAMGGGNITYTLDGETNDTGIFEELAAGNYEVVVSNGGCSTIIPVMITEADPILFDIAATSPLCSDSEDGVIQVIASGGTGPYTYTLNDDSNDTGVFEDLAGGAYDIEIEDDNGCTTGVSFELEAPEPLVLTILDIQDDTGSENGSFNVEGMGGTDPYQFSLDGVNFSDVPPFSDLAFGDYTAFIMDANGCIASTDVTIDFSINTYSVESGIANMSVFPNPFVTNLSVELDLYRAQTLNFTLFTINGVEVQKMQDTFAAGKTTTNLSTLENLTAGTYFLRVVGEEFQGHFKVIKQ